MKLFLNLPIACLVRAYSFYISIFFQKSNVFSIAVNPIPIIGDNCALVSPLNPDTHGYIAII